MNDLNPGASTSEHVPDACVAPIPFVSMRGITKRFGTVHANRGIDLDVLPGEVHGLLGENGAGKTTLMNILYGLTQPDSGTIEIGGKRVAIRTPRDAVELGIGMVHQHYMLVPTLSVAENVILGWREQRRITLGLRDVGNRIRELAGRYGLGVDPEARVSELSVGEKQRVEILKLLYRDARLLVLDEPTAVLTPAECDALRNVVRSLAASGRSVVLITHKLDEMLTTADRCTVLRDGRIVGSVGVSETDKPTLARMMVGRDVVLRVDRKPVERGAEVLSVEDLTLIDPTGRRRLDQVSFAIAEAEILGVAGVDGNGQRELVEILTGVTRPTSGAIRVAGEHLEKHGPRDLRRRAGAVITEDRHATGAVLNLALLENLTMKDFTDRPFSRRGILSARVMREHANRLVRVFNIRASGVHLAMRHLSGGNQQRAILARELHRTPRLLIAAQPTRGLDVGAMEFVYEQLLALRQEGCAVLLISSDLEEIRALSDRIAVMVDGRFVRILDAREASLELLGLLMGGVDESPQ